MTLASGHMSVICQYLSTSSNGFYFETTGPISCKFHIQPSSKRGKKAYIFRPGHMTKMAAMPIYGKNLEDLLQNHKASCFEIWYAASCMANHYFGSVNLGLKKNSKFISKTNVTLPRVAIRT